MMASINPNKTPVKLTLRFFLIFLNDSPFYQFPHIQHTFGSTSERQATGIRGQQDNENTSLERSLMSGGRRNCYPLHHYLVLQRDMLEHGQMSVSATPAGKVQVAKKVSQDPEGDSPDKGAEQCWGAD